MDSSDDEDDGERITADAGLSQETLAMLQLLGLKPKQDDDEKRHPLQKNGDPERTPVDLEATDAAVALSVLERDGVVRIDNILEARFCNECIDTINQSLAHAVSIGAARYPCAGFGNVDSKDSRWDMYLDYEGIYEESFQQMLAPTTILSTLFGELFNGLDAQFYEFAALISDKGAESQRVHADTTYQLNCPLYTVFIALQDTCEDLGPTLFIKGTNTDAAHRDLRHRRDDILSGSTYHQAVLKQGDVVIMDSRTFHCGGENTAGRRILMYFTLLNPSFEDMGGGSKHDHLHLSLHSIQQSAKAGVKES